MSMCNAYKMTAQTSTILKLSSQGINIYLLPAEKPLFPLGTLRSKKEAARQGDKILFFKATERIRGKERSREGHSWGFPLLSHFLCSSTFSVFNGSIVFLSTRGIKLEPKSKKQTLNIEKNNLKTDFT